MRRRHNSETENSITQVVVEETEPELYKDKAIPATNIAKNLFQNLWQIKSESSTSTNPPSISRESSFDKFLPEPEIEFIMTGRDRTVEFANTIRSLQGRNINRAVNLKDPKKVKQIQNYSEFMMIAKTIGKNIASTYAKLEKLTLCEFSPHHHHPLIHIKFFLLFFSGKTKIAFRRSTRWDPGAHIHYQRRPQFTEPADRTVTRNFQISKKDEWKASSVTFLEHGDGLTDATRQHELQLPAGARSANGEFKAAENATGTGEGILFEKF